MRDRDLLYYLEDCAKELPSEPAVGSAYSRRFVLGSTLYTVHLEKDYLQYIVIEKELYE